MSLYFFNMQLVQSQAKLLELLKGAIKILVLGIS